MTAIFKTFLYDRFKPFHFQQFFSFVLIIFFFRFFFQFDNENPFITWTVSNFIKHENNGNKNFLQSSPISFVKWCPQRPSAFFVFDKNGFCFFFDLLQNNFEPVSVEFLGEKNSKNSKFWKTGSGDISRCRPGGKTVFVATNLMSKNNKKNGFHVNVRTLSEDLLQNVRGVSEVEAANILEEKLLRISMSKWLTRTSDAQVNHALANCSDDNDRK